MSTGGITRLLHSGKRQEPEQAFTPNTMFSTGEKSNATHVVDTFEQEKQRAFDEGYQDALKKVQSEWEERLALIDNISNVLNHPLQEIDKVIQEKTAELALCIAKQIVKRELTIDSGQIVSAVKQAIDLIPKDGEKINLHINPKDVEHVNQIFSGDDASNKYNIIQDPSIDVGGCRASTDYSLVDLTVEKQISCIAAQIFGDQRNAN